jgi:hypothetical protein
VNYQGLRKMSVKEPMNLHQIQYQMAQAIMRPLVEGRMQEQWIDDGDTHDFAAQFIKPNKDLNSLERLEIYNQQYWIRLLDSLQEDFPGLQTILGSEKFELLSIAYLTQYPSRSYSLNHLGSNLSRFILEKPDLTYPRCRLAYEMACFEWAEIVAYDAQSKPSLKSKYLQDKDPSQITLLIQPHITILELSYALDDFLLQLNKPIDKSVESNAFASRAKKTVTISLPNKKHIFVAIHRLDNTIYYKRLNSDQYFLLKALKDGQTLAQACHDLISQKPSSNNAQSLAQKLNHYFADWMELNWFCH